MGDGEITRQLVEFVADLDYSQIPSTVIDRTKILFLDWIGSCIAGRSSVPVSIIENASRVMGVYAGKSEIIPTGKKGAPFYASFINGASSHVVELDDLYNAAVFHPGTVVFPSALATAQDLGSSGREFILSSIIGYEIGARVGKFLGKSHYKIFHTTGTAGTLGAATAASSLFHADSEEMLNSIGTAGTQAAGLWEFLRDAAHSKQLHTGKAAANGVFSAYLSHYGFTGARNILEGDQGMGKGMSSEVFPEELSRYLGITWAVLETSLKHFASCRHTHPSADALIRAISEYEIHPEEIKRITAHVHKAAIDVLGPVVNPSTIHQSKFSMPFVLSLISLRRSAGLNDFSEESLHDPKIRDFMSRIVMIEDREIEKDYPMIWKGLVEIELNSGRTIESMIKYPLGDPENFLSRDEVLEKFRTLCRYSNGANEEQIERIIDTVNDLEKLEEVPYLLSYSDRK